MSCEQPEETLYIARMQVHDNTPYHSDPECSMTGRAVRIRELETDEWERYDLKPCSYCCDGRINQRIEQHRDRQ